MQAADASADSTEQSSGRGGSRKRVKAAVTPPDGVDCLTGTVRVLRARGAVSDCNESKKTSTKNKSLCLHRGLRRPAGSKNAPVMKPLKESPAVKVSKNSLGTKPDESIKGKGRPPRRASRTSLATACKPEADPEASSSGEETGASEENNNTGPYDVDVHDSISDPDAALDEDPPFRDDPNDLICPPETNIEQSEQRATLQKEVKKEESDTEEDDIKKEESTEIGEQSDDGAGDATETPRKRGRKQKDDKASRPPKRRKKPPVQYVRCEIEGCGTVLAHPRYLQHHIKYQHLLKKKYMCDHPSCGRLFRLQKQLLRHAKHHTDQRDYICEFCARAFKSSHNLAVHRMIHTGEKPIQCEICGFTCRQKASLNWHMKKHDAEASYQFSCSICNKKFEKKDSVIAHKAKSHPEVLIAEALAANGGSVISSPTIVPESVPTLSHPDTPSASKKVDGGTHTPLEQVVLPLAPQTQVDVPQGQFLQLPTHHVVQVAHQQQPATLLHLTTASPAHLSSTTHPQLIQLCTLPVGTVTAMPTSDQHGTLVSLGSVATLASTVSLAQQQEIQWGRESQEDTQVPGEGELWDRVVVGDGEITWEGNGERTKDGEGVVWEKEGEKQIMLQFAEVHGDGLI
ncbi:E3 ubiquitin-protein ligase ZFP91-like [Labrus mixtus]|uniref:E3 ubiquitin-protein ligase ZFP91-like n=1 Tax=Labrus mixtus TaxID=508554 RepID=UPI0029C07630|nr:E3 ubiquitin-protein ligase ZFP91-like [Labrus mixtus]